jgi:GH35 family endo-1,4-beta-xylanase
MPAFSSALKSSDDDDSEEVLWGAEAIGGVINRTAREVYTLLENKKENGIPIDKVGHRTLKSTRRRLRNWAAGNTQSI